MSADVNDIKPDRTAANWAVFYTPILKIVFRQLENLNQAYATAPT